ncbi:MAG: peptidase S1 [Bauldia sp.]|nr:peptidase S1 [Bauldia sp.]
MTRKLALFAAAAVVSTAALAQTAPNFALDPTFGGVALVAGFVPDPHTVDIVAGGPIDAAAANLGEGCLGFIAEAPDFRLDYTMAANVPLHIFVTATEDTTLVINQPDGTWVCNDDTNGLNPLVSFPAPMTGIYDIYIGTYGAATTPGVLSISEVVTQ